MLNYHEMFDTGSLSKRHEDFGLREIANEAESLPIMERYDCVWEFKVRL